MSKRAPRLRPVWESPVPSAAWRAEADARIESERKLDLKLRLVDVGGAPARPTEVKVELARHEFHFGVAADPEYLEGPGEDVARYRQFILDHFNGLVAENCMKWYAIEEKRGRRDWGPAERFLAFAEEHRLPVRGHCLFWSKTHWVQPWARNLPKAELKAAVKAHLEDTVSRCRGRVIAWDVNNEMLDGTFFEDRLGASIRPWMFRTAHRIDPDAALFLNEYTVLENERRHQAYLALIRSLQEQGVPVGGIGIQEHDAQNVLLPRDRPGRDFAKLGRDDGQLLVPHEVWRRLDDYGRTGLPVHLTEITSWSGDDDRRAEALADFYRLGFAHPSVDAILLWGFWEKRHFRGREACLLTADWTELPAAKALRRLIHKEWTTRARVPVDAAGTATFRGFPGTYVVSVGGKRFVVALTTGQDHATVVI